jgi:DOPA 4,5-dioxygenase
MFHIHVYFTKEKKSSAIALREKIKRHFADIYLGRVHDNPIGPHPVGSYEIDVPQNRFKDIKAFLEENKKDLSMMVHPVTGNDVDDHSSDNISWIGQPLYINRTFFDKH